MADLQNENPGIASDTVMRWGNSSWNESDIVLDASKTERLVEATILSLICVTSLCGNICLWIIILRDKSLRVPSNTLLLCLSMADLLVSAVNMPVIIYTLLQGRWMFSMEICVGLGFVNMLTFVGSVMSLGVISINRYIQICHHTRFVNTYTWRNTAFFILGTWVLSASLSVPPLLGWATYGYLSGQSFCFCDWKTSTSYTFFMVATCFGGPCTVMSFCYFNIMRKVRESKRRVQAFTNYQDSQTASPPTPSAISNTSFSDSSNQRAQSARSSLIRQFGRSKRDSQRKTVRVYSDTISKPISITNQTDIDEHFGPRGYLKSNESLRKEQSKTLPSPSSSSENHQNNITKRESGAYGNNGWNNSDSIYTLDASHDHTLAAVDPVPISQEQTEMDGSTQLFKQSSTAELLLDVKKRTNIPRINLCLSSDNQARHSLSGARDFARSPNTLQVPGRSPNKSKEDTTRSRRRKAALRRRQDEIRLTISLLVVIMVFVLSWLPFCVSMFWYIFSKTPVPRILNMSTLLLGCTNSACNPLIYGLMNRKFKRGFIRLFFSCLPGTRPLTEDSP